VIINNNIFFRFFACSRQTPFETVAKQLQLETSLPAVPRLELTRLFTATYEVIGWKWTQCNANADRCERGVCYNMVAGRRRLRMSAGGVEWDTHCV